jgi:D-alanyl-lipoteichoic acid acyltransferase DltB (MBOAT superfamily)
MFFNSLTYLIFLPVVWLVFFFCDDRFRWLVLLLAGIGFYAALRAPYLLFALGLVVTATYFVGLKLGRSEEAGIRKMLLWTGILVNLLVLVSLKYLPPLVSTLLPLHITLITIGVSYYVFQAISYLIDIYLEIAEPEEHFGYCALYLSFFPKLLQGPIERAGDLLPQLKQPYRFDYDNMRTGLIMFAWGAFKKVVVADRLGVLVNPVYDHVHDYSGFPLLLATWFYALQIYFDFSGYTDMALGSARLFNIQLTRNFNSPYLATSVSDFWRRWHISFSRWILDYIFKPLQMRWRDLRTAGTAAALLVTFLVSGVWHGASAGFIIWGVLHGVYLAVSVYYKPYQKKIHQALRLEKTRLLTLWQTVVTFNLVCLAWVFFRAASLGDAWYIVTHILAPSHVPGSNSLKDIVTLNAPMSGYAVLGAMLCIVTIISILRQRTHALSNDSPLDRLYLSPVWFRWSCYYTLIFLIAIFGKHDSSRVFIYYQF